MSSKDNQTAVDNLKQEIVFNINELKRRDYPCLVLNSKLMELGFDSSNTFKSIFSKVLNLEAGNVERILNDVKKLINEELEKHAALANKRIYFYQVTKEILNKINEQFQSNHLIQDFFIVGQGNDKFDYSPLDHEKIETSLIKKLSDDLKIYYFKQARKKRENKNALDKIHLFENDPDGEVINVIKTIQYNLNAYDFIALDFKNEHLIIGTDLNNSFPKQETEKALDRLQIAVRKLGAIQELTVKNLRNCVENLEKEEGGNVLDHAFATADGGYNHAGRSVTTNQDVRKDKFHADGIKDKEADYYGIVKSYDLPNDEKAIITIRITYKDYKKLNAPIRYAVLNGVTSFDGLRYCISKIIKHNHN